jgi:hypothetical protein
VPADQFESRRKQAVSPNEHALIVCLRNSALHEVHSEANWQKVYRGGSPTTHFVIDREDLLADGGLSEAAKEHLKELGPQINITELLSSYSERVEVSYEWLLPEIEAHLPVDMQDYLDCRRAVEVHQARLTYQFLIKTWINGGVDPYQHLPKYLTSEQLGAAEPFAGWRKETLKVPCLNIVVTPSAFHDIRPQLRTLGNRPPATLGR